MWLRLLTFYFRSPKGSHKIFLGSSLAFFQSLSQRSWVLLEIYNSVPVKQVDVRPLYMLWVTSSGKSPLTHALDGCRQRLISLNWRVLLHNIKYLCPPMAIYIGNCYSVPSRLFVLGGTEISSSERTTQGDPLAMPVSICHWHNPPVGDDQTWISKTCSFCRWSGWSRWTARAATLVG